MINWMWSEKDFDKMSWHDGRIYEIKFGPNKFELSLDLDYITRWILNEETNSYGFEVMPVILTFRNVYDINMGIYSTEPIIDEVVRTNPRPPKNKEFIADELEFDWTIITSNGEISFVSVGFVQAGIQGPIASETQSLGRSWIKWDTSSAL